MPKCTEPPPNVDIIHGTNECHVGNSMILVCSFVPSFVRSFGAYCVSQIALSIIIRCWRRQNYVNSFKWKYIAEWLTGCVDTSRRASSNGASGEKRTGKKQRNKKETVNGNGIVKKHKNKIPNSMRAKTKAFIPRPTTWQHTMPTECEKNVFFSQKKQIHKLNLALNANPMVVSFVNRNSVEIHSTSTLGFFWNPAPLHAIRHWLTEQPPNTKPKWLQHELCFENPTFGVCVWFYRVGTFMLER